MTPLKKNLLEKEEIKEILVDKAFEGFRLDHFLTQTKFVETRSQALKLISKNRVLLQNKAVKASHKVKPSDQLKIILPAKKLKKLFPYNKDVEIVYEDEELLIVNKEAGLVVHPSPGHENKTLVNILFHQKILSSGSHALRPGVVHRLDKDSSGLLVLTKTKQAENQMIEQFKNHLVQREYWAISLHPPRPIKNEIESFLTRHPIYRQKFISIKSFSATGKQACTSYELLQKHETGLSWIKCRLKTGRTHQIRVHLSSISCPLAGDSIYGGNKKLSFIQDTDLKNIIKNLNRVALHAFHLNFTHPLSQKEMDFHSPWPEDLKKLLQKLNFKE